MRICLEVIKKHPSCGHKHLTDTMEIMSRSQDKRANSACVKTSQPVLIVSAFEKLAIDNEKKEKQLEGNKQKIQGQKGKLIDRRAKFKARKRLFSRLDFYPPRLQKKSEFVWTESYKNLFLVMTGKTTEVLKVAIQRSVKWQQPNGHLFYRPEQLARDGGIPLQ